jgi:adenylate cyclase
MSQTRRLAAILAADVAGYSRLIGADEGGTLQTFKDDPRRGVRSEDRCASRPAGQDEGDGFLAEFSSVVDALHCATEVQAQMAERNATVSTDKRIDFRIGINVGDIVVEDGDIFGDGVNVAVRLEGVAEPGGICVSARVQEDAAGKLNLCFDDMGEQQLKNIRPPGAGLPSSLCRQRQGAIRTGITCAAPSRQTVDRGAAFRQYERRSRAGVLRRRDR